MKEIFDAFSDTIDGYVFVGNLKTGEFTYSEKMVQEFGLPGQHLPNAAAYWGKLIHPEDRELFLRSNLEIAEGKSSSHAILYRAKNKKGIWTRLLCKGNLILDDEGNPDIFAGVIRNLDDIEMSRNLSVSAQSSFYYAKEMTGEKQLELRELLLNFVNLYIPGGILATMDDDDFSIICFNQTLIEYMGYTHEEFMQKTGGKFLQFVYEEDREEVQKEVRRQLEEKDVYEVYYRLIRKDGKPAWVYDIGRYKYNEEGERFIASFLMDATNEIEKGQELRFINANSASGIFKAYIGEGFELTYANEGLCRIYGVNREELEEILGAELFRMLDPEEVQKLKKEVYEAVKDGRKQLNLEYRVKRGDGSVGWVHADCNMVMQENGRTIMMGIIQDITERHMLEEQLHHTEQIYKFIGNYTKLDVWEYDAVSESLTIHDVKDGICQTGKTYRDLPEGMIKESGIHPDSIGVLYDTYEKVRRGEDMVVAAIQFERPHGTSVWKQITAISVKDENGELKGAIGLAEDITVQKEAEIRAFQQEKMREILSKDTIYSVHMNLETDHLEAVWSEKEELDISRLKGVTYRDVYHRILASIANEDDRKRFQEEFTPEKMHLYEKEEKFFREIEFRQADRQGRILWVNLSFRIISSPTTGNKILFLYARNIDMVKRRELSLQKKAEVDELTGVYNLTTAKLLIENILKDEKKKSGESAFFLIDIDHFKEVNRTGGFAAGDELLQQIGAVLAKKSPSSSVTGRINGDMFVVYLYGRRTKKAIHKEVEELHHLLEGDYICGNNKFTITVSMGAVCFGERRMTYDSLYQCAYNALDAAKRGGGGHLIFYDGMMGSELRAEGKEKEIGAIFRQSLEWIRKGEAKKEVYRTFLEYIGKFCDAEEVTMFQKDASGTCSQTVGWKAYRKGETLEANPDGIRYFFDLMKMAEPEPSVYISGRDSAGYEEAKKAYGVEQLEYPVLLMGECGKAAEEIVILVEKCENRIPDTEFCVQVLDMLKWIEYLYSIQKNREEALRNDQKTGLLNYESFVQRIENMNEDMLSALGMIGMQMVDLKKYNQQYGRIKGDESLIFAADCLSRIFGRKNCYRVGGTSFFAVCENMAYEQFMESHKRLEQELEKGYKEWIVTSSAWEQSSIVPAKLQEQIEEKLAIAQNKKKNRNAISEKTLAEIEENIQERIEDGSFRVFLQPKGCLNNGRVCGAEALVRLYDKKQGIIPPVKFLPAIEQAGLIRYIDLFILKSVCRLIKEWMAEGWEAFPISLNYSRMTILEPDILEETNRIVEAFGIPKDLIEIEITESIGSIDNMSLKNIVDRFAESGYRIALDDYGAEYSNVYVLYSLRLNTLKLDRRIVNDVYHDNKARIIVKSVIDICRQFDIKCVAEGVETKEHLEVLKEMSCDMIQGYYLNKPLPEEEFREYYIGRQTAVL